MTELIEVQSVSSEVRVAVDPVTAFTAFTDEMDLWWVRGPINFFGDAGRIVEIRCEHGVGGRIVEVYDRLDSDESLERARITTWDPPKRVGWQSSVDDVETEVVFAPADGGTLVTVTHRIPPGGADRGGTSWSRVVPNWFGTWCAKRDAVPHQPIDIARLGLCINYARPAAAARWLRDVFGFAPESPLPDGEDPLPHTDHGHPWIEFRIGNVALHVFPMDPGQSTGPANTHVPWVYVDDLEAHFHRAEQSATIISDIHPYPGSKVYEALDLEGNRWMFSQARPLQR
jgi:uncharacterized glyoxalase superfamily protein PhnB